MKKSQLRQIIREEISKLKQPTSKRTLKEYIDFPEMEDEYEGAISTGDVSREEYLTDIINGDFNLMDGGYYEVESAIEQGYYSEEEAYEMVQEWAKWKLSELKKEGKKKKNNLKRKRLPKQFRAKEAGHDFSRNIFYKEYDDDGNVVYEEEKNGDWMEMKYDSQGNNILTIFNNGEWNEHKYDSQGNNIYYASDNGYWNKSEYDHQGNKIYYETSTNGVEIDKRRK